MYIPLIIGIAAGIFLPSSIGIINFVVEEGRRREASKIGFKRWTTFCPQKLTLDRNGNVQPCEGNVDFDPRHAHYMKCAEVLITIASASLVFIPNLHFTAKLPWLALPLMLFGFTVVDAVLFMVTLTFFYEDFLNNPLTYTNGRRSAIYALGFGSLTSFAFAYSCIALLVSTAASNGNLVFTAH